MNTKTSQLSPTVALVEWTNEDEIAKSILHELKHIGYQVIRCHPGGELPLDADFIFTYAPYGRWRHIPEMLAQQPVGRRPLLVHWNTEGLPNPRVPLMLQKSLSLIRSGQDSWLSRRVAERPSLFMKLLQACTAGRILRFRYLGDYLYLAHANIPFLLVDISALYQKRLDDLGVPAVQMPFGSSELWFEALKLKRDIDVLWMGSRATIRRSYHLTRIQNRLARQNIRLKVVDDKAEPFVFGQERIKLLNRTKIVLNLARTAYDDNTLRLFLAMPNKALVISEPLFAHGSGLVPGEHYVEAPLGQIPETVRHYLNHAAERRAIVARAYAKTTHELSMRRTVGAIMEQAERQRQAV